MADYKSCAWYQNGTCIRDDKSGAHISCADCEDYERRVVFKIEDAPENCALADEVKADMVNHPPHYTAGGIECIDALKAATTRLTGIEAVCTANAIKYLWRWKDKNGAEDIRKAIWYCERLLKEIGDEREE